jgi:UDP-N-acetylmuramyl pentapeptide phosphotransferase/UDP-N-acetylglucosamine-1-phosphate transferase
LDGLDAMCGSVSLVAAGGFCFLLSGDARTFAFAVATAAAAFLVFNRPPAQIYLGDGGSYLLGLCLCALLALAWTPGTPLPTGVGALVLVFVPVAEVLWAAWRRARAGESLLVGDRDHPYDVLIRSGWSVERTVGAYALAGMLLVVVAVGASHLSTPLAWILVGASALGVLAAGVAALPGSRRSRSAGGIAT